jgi:hypothetical protein
MSEATLTQLHESWEAALRERMPILKTVEAYKPDATDGKVDTPAVLLDMEDFEEGASPLDNPFCWRLRWSFFCLISNQTPKPEIAAREFALAVSGLVKSQNFNFENVGEPQRVDGQPAGLRPGMTGYQCWVVSFEHDFTAAADRAVGGIGDFKLANATVDLNSNTPGLIGVDVIKPAQD